MRKATSLRLRTLGYMLAIAGAFLSPAPALSDTGNGCAVTPPYYWQIKRA